MVTQVSLASLPVTQAASWTKKFMKKSLSLPKETLLFYIFRQIFTNLKREVRISVWVFYISGKCFKSLSTSWYESQPLSPPGIYSRQYTELNDPFHGKFLFPLTDRFSWEGQKNSIPVLLHICCMRMPPILAACFCRYIWVDHTKASSTSSNSFFWFCLDTILKGWLRNSLCYISPLERFVFSNSELLLKGDEQPNLENTEMLPLKKEKSSTNIEQL